MTEKSRLHLAMPAGTKAKMDEMQLRIGASTVTELIKRALALLDAVTREESQGSTFWVHRADGTHAPVLWWTDPDETASS